VRGSNSRIVVEALAGDPETADFLPEELHEDGDDVVVVGTAAGDRVAWRAAVSGGAIVSGPDRVEAEEALRDTGLAETTARDIDAVRRHYEAFNRDDVDAIVATLRPDVEIVGGDERAGGAGERSHGRDEAKRFFTEIKELVADNQAEVLTLEARPGRVEASVRLRGTLRGSGESGVVPAVHFFTVTDGLIARIETYRPDWRSHALPGAGD
jgi:ketosteroid isomerase-like protein